MTGTPMRCQNCGHEWEYTGNADVYASCPTCRYRVHIEKHRQDK
jgi:DNA-directed RNA polymerase subunit RPC12/RpoP